MSELIQEEKKDEIEEGKGKKRTIIPEICTYNNEDDTGYTIEVILPGVEKENIKLKLNDDNVFVTGETESIRYIGAYGLCCPIDPEKATSTYKEGLLKINVPFKDITLDTVEVKIE